jgi:signal transduction histidine kinase
MRDAPEQLGARAVTRAAQHIWLTVAFVLVWLHFSYVRPHLRLPDWQIYTLYLIAVSGVAARYLTGIRHGRARWHRVLFDGLSILIIALGVNFTGGIRSDLWLVLLIFVIAETLAASARGFLISDTVAILSYVVATWPEDVARASPSYFEMLATRIFFLVLVASIARAIAAEERQRQADLAALREALSVSEERRRLARDLHDGVGHVLTRVILSLELARRECLRDPAAAAETMTRQAAALRGAMEEMRQLVATLRTDTSGYSLQAAVRAMAAEVEATGTLRLTLELPEAPLPLSPHRQFHLSRVIQEALTNVLRHARASSATVRITVQENPVGPPRVIAQVFDDGVGFDPAPYLRAARAALPGEVDAAAGITLAPGHGLQGMSERLAPYGGSVQVESAPGQGTRVTAELPGDQYESPLARLAERVEAEVLAAR